MSRLSDTVFVRSVNSARHSAAVAKPGLLHPVPAAWRRPPRKVAGAGFAHGDLRIMSPTRFLTSPSRSNARFELSPSRVRAPWLIVGSLHGGTYAFAGSPLVCRISTMIIVSHIWDQKSTPIFQQAFPEVESEGCAKCVSRTSPSIFTHSTPFTLALTQSVAHYNSGITQHPEDQALTSAPPSYLAVQSPLGLSLRKTHQ